MPNIKEDTTTSAFITPFVNNVNTILNQLYDQSNVPTFIGTTYYNNQITNITTSVAFINPQAIPVNDLDFKSNAGINNINIGTRGNFIVGSTVYITFFDIIKRLTRARKFTSSWYHQTNSSYALVNTASGKAMFKESLPGIQGTGGISINTATSGWDRSVNGNTIQNISVPNPGLEKHKDTSANVVNTFFTNLNNAWTSAANNEIHYNFYSCHNNCHNNCHDNCHGSGRSRR